MKKTLLFLGVMMMLIVGSVAPVSADSGNKSIGINVLLNIEISDAVLAELGGFGKVNDLMPAINAVTMKVKTKDLEAIQALSFVAAANPDAERKGAPIDTVAVEDFVNGLSTWDQDAINVTDAGFANRVVSEDGSGVYVAVLDTGLVDSWRQYFPEERIAEEYAKSFGGGGGENAAVSEQPNKWEHDQNSHGTHVTSSILGYSLSGTPINGAAPMATVIPVKVLNQNGSGWSSVIARGIEYIGELKEGPLADYPVVINMSLGGSALDAVEQAAIDYAISKGVIIVASAGNEGEAGMGYPGAYEPVISVAASGWTGEWLSGSWWTSDVPDPATADDFYIVDFSSRELFGQDLDVAAPGSWIVGPYQVNSGQTSFYYLGGTSMASPHVAGLVALMLQKNPALDNVQAETLLEDTALALPAGCRYVVDPNLGAYVEVCWGDDASGSGMVDAISVLSAVPTP
ncbi:MAG: S8 family serine peptidase [Chloroflexota bacterium]|nr:S8 family serine peptidase [Chloroflexota bacterium]